MATVVIIHAAEDTLPARALAEKLRQAKLTVVLEQPPGEELRNAVKSAQVTLALWSPRSMTEPTLSDEVGFARGKSKVFHATMQNAQVPEPFRSDKTVNLTGWRGEDEFPAWRELAKLVTDKAGVAPLPPPAPKPPSGFFNPGRVEPSSAGAARAPLQRSGQPQQQQQHRPAPRPPPPPAQPQARSPQRAAAPPPPSPQSGGGGRGMMMGVIGLIVVAALGGGGYYFWSQSQSAQTTSAAWDGIDSSDASALRAFIAENPGEFRDEAETALVELEERTFEAASDSDSIEALEAFLNEFPESEHAISAQGRIAELRTLPQAPSAAETPALEATPVPDLAPSGAAAPEASGGPAALTPAPAENPPPAEPESAPTN